MTLFRSEFATRGVLLLGTLSLFGCSSSHLAQLGEACDSATSCAGGLVCFEEICFQADEDGDPILSSVERDGGTGGTGMSTGGSDGGTTGKPVGGSDGGTTGKPVGGSDGGTTGGSDGGATTVVEPPACEPVTCLQKGRQCGKIPDGCGQQIACGTCDPGFACDENNFCVPECVEAADPIHEGSLTINSNDALGDIEKLRGKTHVTGDLTVTLSGLASLDLLACLREVGGDLRVEDHGLTSLAGLDRLETIGGSLILEDNASMRSPIRLQALRSVGGSLEIDHNGALTDLTGLGALERIPGNLRISENNHLDGLQGLESLTEIGGTFYLRENRARSLAGLSGLQTVVGELDVYRTKLRSFEGLDSLREVGGLEIYGNEKLRSVEGMDSLTDVHGVVWVSLNPDLETLDGLASLATIDGSLSVTYNEALTSMGVAALQSVGAKLVLSRNNSLPVCEAERVANQVGTLCSADGKNGWCTDICTCRGNDNDAVCE